MCVCVRTCEEEEIEMQQSNDCDSSSRPGMNSDAIARTYRVKRTYVCVCIGAWTRHVNDFLPPGVPHGASLQQDITRRGTVLGNLLHRPPSAVAHLSSSPPQTFPPES